MKIIHCADLHLDSRMESSLTREQAAERRSELLDTFVRMADYADEQKVRAVIIAGDLFDTPAGTGVRLKRRVTDRMKASPDIDFLYLKGNHDKAGISGDIPENLKLFDKEWTYYEYENVTVAGCETNTGDTGTLASCLSLKTDRLNIVVMHGQCTDYEKKDSAQTISINAMQGKNIDYLALGHLHSFGTGRIDKRGIFCYSGCLEGRGFDECGEKGFVMLDISDGGIRPEFIAFAMRTLHDVEVKLSGHEEENNIKELTAAALEGIPAKDMVKITYTGEVDEDTDIDTAYIAKCFSGRFYFLKVCDHTELSIDYSEYADEVSLKGEFIRLVTARHDLDDNTRQQIIRTGIRALAGREIDI